MKRILYVAVLSAILLGCSKKKAVEESVPAPEVPAPVAAPAPAPPVEPTTTPIKPGPAGDATMIYSRNDFRTAVKGKTREEVRARLGLPNSTAADRDDEYWYYHERTREKEGGDVDERAMVAFKKGVAQRVTFLAK